MQMYPGYCISLKTNQKTHLIHREKPKAPAKKPMKPEPSTLSSTQKVRQSKFVGYARSLSRERSFITYDDKFIEDIKTPSRATRIKHTRAETPVPVRANQSQQLQKSEVSYKKIKEKREAGRMKLEKRQSNTPKRAAKSKKSPSVVVHQDFKDVFPDSKKLMQIRKAQFNYSLKRGI